MAVFRVNKNEGYTVMSNFHLRDERLTLKAKGLLSQMLSLPPDWKFNLRGLEKLNREKIGAISSAVCELENAGYVVRHQGRYKNGKMADIVYDVYEKPLSEKPYAKNPNTVKAYTDKPSSENPILLNIEETNTEEINTDLLNINPINQDGIDEIGYYRKIIYKNIEYSIIEEQYDKYETFLQTHIATEDYEHAYFDFI